MFQFNHFNFNVLNLEKSLEFYKEALGLDVVREKDASDGSFKIVYLGLRPRGHIDPVRVADRVEHA